MNPRPVRFTIPGPPYGKPTVSISRAGHRYVTAATRAFYGMVQRHAPRVDHPFNLCGVSIVAIRPRPKRRPRSYRLPWNTGRAWCGATPDCDNVAKATLDAIGRVSPPIWVDDRVIAWLTVATVYAALDESAATEVTIIGLDHQIPTKGER